MFSIFYTFTVKTPRIAMMENKIICMIKTTLNTLYRYVDRKLEISPLCSDCFVNDYHHRHHGKGSETKEKTILVNCY